MKNYLASITQKRALVIVIVVIVVGSLVAAFNKGQKKEEAPVEPRVKTVRIEEVTKQNTITTELTVSGTAIPREYSAIRSLTPGTVEFIVPVGENIVRGQSLFSIRDANVESAYFNALEDLNSTQASTDQQVVQAELGLTSKEAALDFAQKSLETTKEKAVQNYTTAQNSAIVSYNSAYNGLTQILNSVGTGAISDTSTYVYSNVITTESQLRSEARAQFDTITGLYTVLPKEVSQDTIVTSLDMLLEALQETKKLVDATVIILKNSADSSLAADLAAQIANQTTVNSLITSIITSSDALNTALINNDFSIKQDENRVALAQIEYDNAVVALESALTNSRIQNSSVKARFDAAAYSFGNLTLASPFSGTVLSHKVSPGEQVTTGQELIEIGNLSIIEVDVAIDAAFVNGLKVQDNVVINDSIPGFISEIEPVGSIVSGKVGVKVQSDENSLITGDIADVQFDLIYEAPESIVIPIKAATIEEVRTTVFVEEDGKAAVRTVSLGTIIGDQVTVISGLTEGDRLIVPDGTFISEGDLVQAPTGS